MSATCFGPAPKPDPLGLNMGATAALGALLLEPEPEALGGEASEAEVDDFLPAAACRIMANASTFWVVEEGAMAVAESV